MSVRPLTLRSYSAIYGDPFLNDKGGHSQKQHFKLKLGPIEHVDGGLNQVIGQYRVYADTIAITKKKF